MQPENIKSIELKLEEYTHFLAFCLCHCKSTVLEDRYCARLLRTVEQRKYSKSNKQHHQGYFYKLLSEGPSISDDDIDKWANDLDHGLLHSFFVGFLAFLHKGSFHWDGLYENDCEDVQLILSCLVHDFLRCTGHPVENHDKDLEELFPSLDSSVYTHGHPTQTDHPLVVGDRTELRRFDDHELWVDWEMLDYRFDDDLLSDFYRHIRPALKELWKCRNELWLRHGPERKPHYRYTYKQDECYPLNYWSAHADKDYWSIDVGKLPFAKCITHSFRFVPWGMISLSKFREFGGEISPMPLRDHLAAKGNIPIKDWVFLLDHKFDIRMKENHWELAEWGKGCVGFKVANQIVETLDKVVDMFKALRGQ